MEHQAQAAATPKTEPPSALPTEAAQPPALDPGLAPLDPSTIRQLHATIPGLPAPVLEGFSKAFRKRFQVPAEALSIADRICQRRHYEWIERFLVQHQLGQPATAAWTSMLTRLCPKHPPGKIAFTLTN